jgi:hypothetical protein
MDGYGVEGLVIGSLERLSGLLDVRGLLILAFGALLWFGDCRRTWVGSRCWLVVEDTGARNCLLLILMSVHIVCYHAYAIAAYRSYQRFLPTIDAGM